MPRNRVPGGWKRSVHAGRRRDHRRKVRRPARNVKRAFCFIALACLACGAKPPARDASAKRWREDPRALIAEVAAVRGLADSRPTPIVFDDAATFARALDLKAEKDAIGPTSADQD